VIKRATEIQVAFHGKTRNIKWNRVSPKEKRGTENPFGHGANRALMRLGGRSSILQLTKEGKLELLSIKVDVWNETKAMVSRKKKRPALIKRRVLAGVVAARAVNSHHQRKRRE